MNRIFHHFPKGNGTLCPLCNTDRDQPCTLITVDGTLDEKNNREQCLPVHVQCLINCKVRKGPSGDWIFYHEKAAQSHD
jgi:hypothetical protein